MIGYLNVLQAFYRTGEGDSVISHRSDVWLGCVTMMNILVGKQVNEVPDKQVCIYVFLFTFIVCEMYAQLYSTPQDTKFIVIFMPTGILHTYTDHLCQNCT